MARKPTPFSRTGSKFVASMAENQPRLLSGFSACRSIGITITLVPTLTRE
jgi:hypothetical protein